LWDGAIIKFPCTDKMAISSEPKDRRLGKTDSTGTPVTGRITGKRRELVQRCRVGESVKRAQGRKVRRNRSRIYART